MAVHSENEDAASLRRPGGRGFVHPLALAWFATIGCLFALVVGIAVFGHPPPRLVARVDLKLDPRAVAPVKGPAAAAQLPPATLQQPAAPTAAQTAPQAAASPPPSPSAPVYAGKALLADPALIETTPQGPLPRIAADGRTPMGAYAPLVKAVRGKKIAIVITGLGLDARATRAAIDDLPAAVTLAFAPYGARLDDWVRVARSRGHEVLLEVPMEPRDFPDSDAGPHSLRPSLSADDNLARLKWALSRATGYVGVTNLMGGRFLAEPLASEPVLSFLASRGLMFFDTSPGALAAGVARQLKAPYLKSSLRLDRVAAPAQIDRRLAELESVARSKGQAVGTGFVYPVTLAHIASWARGLRGQGFVLVPASSIVEAKR